MSFKNYKLYKIIYIYFNNIFFGYNIKFKLNCFHHIINY